jgi:thioredoxin 1
MSEISELNKKEFEKNIKQGTTLVDFYADWCMPCVMMAPIIEDMSEKFKGKIKFAKINIDDNQALAQKFGIMSIPNFVLFKDGKKVGQFIGSMSEEDFEKKLKNFA